MGGSNNFGHDMREDQMLLACSWGGGGQNFLPGFIGLLAGHGIPLKILLFCSTSSIMHI